MERLNWLNNGDLELALRGLKAFERKDDLIILHFGNNETYTLALCDDLGSKALNLLRSHNITEVVKG